MSSPSCACFSFESKFDATHLRKVQVESWIVLATVVAAMYTSTRHHDGCMPHLKDLQHAPSSVDIATAITHQAAALSFLEHLASAQAEDALHDEQLQQLRLPHPSNTFAHSRAACRCGRNMQAQLQMHRILSSRASQLCAACMRSHMHRTFQPARLPTALFAFRDVPAAGLSSAAEETSDSAAVQPAISGGTPASTSGQAAARPPHTPGNDDLQRRAADLQQQWRHACAHLSCLPGHQRSVQQLQVPRVLLQELRPAPAGAEALHERTERARAAPTVLQIALYAPDAHFTKTQTLLARSDHTLAELKDAIRCVNDEYAHDALGQPTLGGLFFVNETLYADTRSAGQPGHVDYAHNISEFLASHSQEMQHSVRAAWARKGLRGDAAPNLAQAHAVVKTMQVTRLRDLSVTVPQMGTCLYVHAGACEHIVVFEDVRLPHSGDPCLAHAPATLPRRRPRLEKCCICAVRPAVKMAFDDRLAPESPAFFCERCFDDLHYDENGVLCSEARDADVYEMY